MLKIFRLIYLSTNYETPTKNVKTKIIYNSILKSKNYCENS
jgi:hypothetical protein